MAYIDRNLLPDEQILFRTKKNFMIFINAFVWTAVFIFFRENSMAILQQLSIVPGIIAVFMWGNQWLNYVTSDFAVTTKRIMLREGFFFRHTNETRLATVANITVNQSLLGQLFNYGTLMVNSFGGENDPFVMINSPVAFQRQVLMQMDKVLH